MNFIYSLSQALANRLREYRIRKFFSFCLKDSTIKIAINDVSKKILKENMNVDAVIKAVTSLVSTKLR